MILRLVLIMLGIFVMIINNELCNALEGNKKKSLKMILKTMEAVQKYESEVEKMCKEIKCLWKCCEDNQYIARAKMCKNFTSEKPKLLDFSDVTLFDKHLHKTGKSLRDIYTAVPGRFANKTFRKVAFDYALIDHRRYLTEDGILYEEIPNRFKRWFELSSREFCVEYQPVRDGTQTQKMVANFWTVINGTTEELVPAWRSTLITMGFLVSSVFLALVLVVYCLLSELRNLGGLVLMSYSASLLGAFLLLTGLRFFKSTVTSCHVLNGPKLLYLYVPMLIMILCNWAFFLMTACNLRRLHSSTDVLDSAAAGSPAAHRTQRHRLMVYLKLSIVMGVNWVLEVVSFFLPHFKLWCLSDVYNVLIGFFIFLIFVCKRDILSKLVKRYRSYKQHRRVQYKSQFSDTSDTYLNPESPLQVCSDPKGDHHKR